jgi:hypothetical protein
MERPGRNTRIAEQPLLEQPADVVLVVAGAELLLDHSGDAGETSATQARPPEAPQGSPYPYSMRRTV